MLWVGTPSPSLGSMSVRFPFYFYPIFGVSVKPEWDRCRRWFCGIFSPPSESLTRLRIHNDGYCDCPPSIPLLRTEMESESIEERSRRLWRFLSPSISAPLLRVDASCTKTCAVDVSHYSSLFENNTQDEGDSHGFSHPIRAVQPMHHNQDEG